MSRLLGLFTRRFNKKKREQVSHGALFIAFKGVLGRKKETQRAVPGEKVCREQLLKRRTFTLGPLEHNVPAAAEFLTVSLSAGLQFLCLLTPFVFRAAVGVTN